MEVIFKLVQIFICVLEAYLIIDFFMAFFKLRGFWDKKYTRTGLISGIALCIYSINIFNSTTLNMIATFVIYLSVILFFFQGKLFKKFLYYITVVIIMLGSEFLGVILLSLQTDFSPNHVETNQAAVSFLMLSLKLITLVLYSIIKRSADSSENRKINFQITLWYSIMPISLIGIMIAVTRLNIDFSSLGFTQLLLLASCILALIGSVVIFYVFDRYSQSIWKLQQQEVMITKLEMEEKHYGQIERVNQEHAAFLHDVRRFMKVIGEMAADNDNRAILQILSEMQIKVSNIETEMLCPNRLLNAILNEKKKDAERRNISIKIVVEPGFSIDRVSDTDLIVMVSNLFDNALEAAGKRADGFIRANLFSQNMNHFSVIKIVNNYADSIQSRDGRLWTGKPDRIRHGYGIQNVNDMAEKYGGYLYYFYEDGVFSAVVVLPASIS
ncbi:MAG: GHKL domain-containing protein [Lachnospiraceae bacterium]|nr:GHKL domain-containing protein [Lachnospiraceae bacterium]